MGAGMLCVSGAALFYRQKRTTPFKLAYFLSWPVLGTAILKVFGPDRSEMERELRTRGLDAQQLEANRQMTQLQMARLRDVAKEGKEN